MAQRVVSKQKANMERVCEAVEGKEYYRLQHFISESAAICRK